MTTTEDAPSGRWTPKDSDFGARVWALRRELGWNRTRLAKAIGISQATIGQWERMGIAPRNMPEVVQAISDATGVDRDWLMWGETSRDSGSDGDLRTGNRWDDRWPYAA